jgi:hypothetical protein
VHEDVPEQRAPPEGEDLAGIAALLALKNTLPIGNPSLHTPAPEKSPRESQVGEEGMRHQETIARELPGESVAEEVVKEMTFAWQRQAGATRGQGVEQTTPARAETEGRSAGPRENRGALPRQGGILGIV